MREDDQNVNRILNFIHYSIGGIQIIDRDVFPNLDKIKPCFGMKTVPGHERPASRASFIARRRALTSSPLINLTLPVSRSS